MSEENNKTSNSSSSSNKSGVSNILGVPIAIVLAGGLIAVAIYFGGGAQPAAPVGGEVPLGEIPDIPEPAAPVVGDIRPVTDADHIRGAANAKLTIIEYSDLECPFCARFHPTVAQLVDEYPNDVRWVYRHFPLEQLHDQAKPEAVATECAGEQGKFWELTDLIYETTPSNDGLDLETLPQMATTAGVANIPQFSNCLTSGKYDERIEEDLLDAQTAGGNGTPYSVIIDADGNKTAVSGAQPYATVKATVDSLLK